MSMEAITYCNMGLPSGLDVMTMGEALPSPGVEL